MRSISGNQWWLGDSLIIDDSEITTLWNSSKLNNIELLWGCKMVSLTGAVAFQNVTRAHLRSAQNMVDTLFCERKSTSKAWLLDLQVEQGRKSILVTR